MEVSWHDIDPCGHGALIPPWHDIDLCFVMGV